MPTKIKIPIDSKILLLGIQIFCVFSMVSFELGKQRGTRGRDREAPAYGLSRGSLEAAVSSGRQGE